MRSGTRLETEAARPGLLRRHGKHLFLLFALLIVASVLWYLKQPHGLRDRGDPGFDPLAGREGTMVTDVHLTQFDKQRTRWTLDAPSAQRGEEKRIQIHHPRLAFALEGQEEVVVTSESGEVDGATGRMSFAGRVVAGDPAMGRMMTEQLRFDPEKKILYTELAFRMEREEMRLEGQGLTVEQETHILKVDSHVRMTFPSAILMTEQP
ncbi:MAG: LPS export ABC transporter periplasmic protein LptC [Magnetococcales bacterium]|nr:LPS export ABC transporter periplasmic protein LptC [Magnetococcales bacterium]